MLDGTFFPIDLPIENGGFEQFSLKRFFVALILDLA